MSGETDHDHRLRSGAEAVELADGLVLIRLPEADPRFPPGLLTATEQEVAREVFGGASNSEVAERRGVSVKTIANQLRSIYDKLGVTSRVEMVVALLGPPASPGDDGSG